MMKFVLTPELRRELKRPLGTLVRGEIPTPYFKIRGDVEESVMSIAVGDVVTENLLKLGLKPDVAIYDHKTKREDYSPDIHDDAIILTVQNPAGTVTKALLNAIRKGVGLARRGKRVYIKVSGEEDLAAIPAVLYAPQGAVVIYGQPDEGVVLIKVTPECKRRCAKIFAKMEVADNGD